MLARCMLSPGVSMSVRVLIKLSLKVLSERDSERDLAIARPSVVCLSVCNVRAPYLAA